MAHETVLRVFQSGDCRKIFKIIDHDQQLQMKFLCRDADRAFQQRLPGSFIQFGDECHLIFFLFLQTGADFFKLTGIIAPDAHQSADHGLIEVAVIVLHGSRRLGNCGHPLGDDPSFRVVGTDLFVAEYFIDHGAFSDAPHTEQGNVFRTPSVIQDKVMNLANRCASSIQADFFAGPAGTDQLFHFHSPFLLFIL